jgi:hypothetical protein
MGPYTARSSAPSGQQCTPIGRCHLCGAARAWRILQAFHALCPIAVEPAQRSGLALTDDGRDLGHLEPLVHREEDHLCPRPQPRSLGGTVQVVEWLPLRWC